MPITTIILIAISLSMDAFAVSIAKGLCVRQNRVAYGLILAAAFGLFQAGMPVIGYFLGSFFRSWFLVVDHWIAFTLLAWVGGHMIWQSFKAEAIECPTGINYREVLTLAVATSIDALAVGVSLAFVSSPIFVPAVIIGCITFSLTLLGFMASNLLGSRWESWAERAGGLVLILIGCKIVLEHML